MATSEAPPYPMTPIDNVMPRNYVPQVLFFPEPPRSDVRNSINAFRGGLSRTLEAIAPLSGTVQVIGPRGELGVTGPWNNVDDILHVKDLRQDLQVDYQSLKDQNFPTKALDEKLIYPLADFQKDVKRVMVVQLNVIKGGIIMVLCLHHSFTDGNGTIAIVRAWAGYCRGGDDSPLVTREMLDRERLMRGWGRATLADVPDFMSVRIKEKVSPGGILTYIHTNFLGPLMTRLSKWITGFKTTESNALAQYQYALFFLPKSKLAELKSMASTPEHGEDGNTWVSTNDALCALISCCVHSAIDKNTRALDGRTFTVGMVVDGRRMLEPPLPAGYIGNILTFIGLNVPSRSMNSTPAKVAELAHLFRAQIKQRDERYIRKVIAALSSVEDLTSVVVTPPSPGEDRLAISSWASQKFYDLNWGDAIGSRVERLRIPLAVQNMCIILPEVSTDSSGHQDCGLEVVVNLEEGQMGRLKQNELFTKFAEY